LGKKVHFPMVAGTQKTDPKTQKCEKGDSILLEWWSDRSGETETLKKTHSAVGTVKEKGRQSSREREEWLKTEKEGARHESKNHQPKNNPSFDGARGKTNYCLDRGS